MAKAATYLRLRQHEKVPKTLTLPTIVGEPLLKGSVIRLTDEGQINALIGEDTSFKHTFQDGSSITYFEDVTAEYANREKAKAPLAEKVDVPAEEEGEEVEESAEEAKEETKASATRATRARK